MSEVEEYTLREDSELRFVVQSGDAVLELTSGRAEIFGSEIEKHKRYNFPTGSRVAVYTYLGATLELIGSDLSAYTSEQTPMVIYLNTHAALEEIRKEAEESTEKRGPCIMLVGPTDVGKSTVCRILCNYSVRMGRAPIMVDLDVGQNSISVPGTIAALFINKTADVLEGFDKSHPLVFNFGAVSPSENLQLYDLLVKELADIVAQRCKANPDANIGGIIINTCGWVHGEGYQCLVHAAEAFEVDAVVVLDHERLYNDLQRDLPSFVKIVHQPKSGGIENRSREVRAASRSLAIQKYFYGTRTAKMNPYTFEVNFSDVIIAKIGTEKLPESCLPFGTKQDDHTTKVVSVKPSVELLHRMLAVSPCPAVSPAVVKEPVLGFVVVTDVNIEKSTLSLLSPQQQFPAKNPVLVLTTVQFVDDHTPQT